MSARLQWLAVYLVAALAAAVLLIPGLGCGPNAHIARLTVLVSGYTLAYIKNCGCSSGQKGGEVRKARLIKEERKMAKQPRQADRGLDSEVLLVELGNFTDPVDAVHKVQSKGVVESMKLLAYDSVGLGFNELRYQQDELYQLLNDPSLKVCAANLSFKPPTIGKDSSKELAALVRPFVVTQYESGFRVGIIHLIDTNIQDELPDGYGYELLPCGPAAEQLLRKYHDQADLWLITIANPLYQGADLEAIGKLEDALLAIGVTDPNPHQDERSAQVVYPYFVSKPYEKAKDVVRVQVYFGPDKAQPVIDNQRIAISDLIQPDTDAQKILDKIQPELEAIQNIEDEKNKGIVRHPTYMGTESCSECHVEMVEQLSKSKHVHAYETLIEKKEQKSARCTPCHVVGHALMGGKKWSGGWNVLDNPPAMQGVQCENCHGPGEYHIQAHRKGAKKPAELSTEGRDEFGLLPASDQTCIVCHDPANSPNFDFNTYWPKIEHKHPGGKKPVPK